MRLPASTNTPVNECIPGSCDLFNAFATMNLRIILIWLFLCEPFAAVLFAQSPELNFSKYQIYRDRLLDDFMVSSNHNEAGTNIPASLRNKKTGQIRWGDATINLSNYMAMLATEYKLFKINNLPVKQTLIELHNALSAIERLDIHADIFYGYRNAIPLPNGFFIRDDVPVTFTRDWAWKNPSFADYPLVRSDFTEANIRLNEMSQDQVWHLLIGLALVAHLVDDSTGWQFLPPGNLPLMTLSQRAMLTTHRIILSLQHKKCYFIFKNGSPCLHRWQLHNPITSIPVKRGSDPRFLKYGFAEAGNMITAEKFGNMHWGFSPFARVWFSLARNAQYFQRFTVSGNKADMYHVGALATIGHVWSTRDLLRIYNKHKKQGFKSNPQYEHFALISCLLHDDCPPKLVHQKPYFENLLNVAPPEGTSNFGSETKAPFEWSSINRFVWPERRGSGTSENLHGEYNGLDYLLLYNLYHLVYHPDGIRDLKE